MLATRRYARTGPATAIAAALLLLATAAPAHALKLATWNLIDYPDLLLSTRQPNLRTEFAALDPDLVILQELKSQAGRDSFLINVLNVVQPGQWAATGYFSTCESAMFYKTAKLTLTFAGSAVVTAGPRDVLACTFKPAGYVTSITTQFRIYSVHFKAGTSCSPLPCDSTVRRQECWDLRNTINLAAAGTQFLIGGDTNFYGDYEPGYTALTVSTADNDGRGKDPNPITGTWNSFTNRFHHSQSPCLSGCPSGFYSTGGLDDKFDFWLTSYNLQDSEGTDITFGTAFPYGNDGLHYNDSVNGGGFNNAVGITVANALFQASDHLPTIVELKVPSKIAAASQLDFGSVIVGGTAQQTLAVSNPASTPADDLDYSFVATAGFTAPGGNFSALAGAAANNHTLSMSTATTGVKTGRDTVKTDAPDSLTKLVLLSGRVLAHAVPSLDSTTTVVDDSLDFGSQSAGAFRDSTVRAHNRGYNSLQAQLAVNAGVITGGGGHFTFVGGFQSALLAGVGQSYTVHFEATGATLDSTYEATLTFSTADEALPGAVARPDLVVHLVARPVQGAVDVPGAEAARALRLYPARPNPFSGETRFALDLPQAAPVSFAVFDLSGRRVANLVDGTVDPGHHEYRWRARDERGARVAPGLYFARFVTPGLSRTQRLVVLP